ncbi:UNVERIFIED_ORG: hypothetical protein J3A77_000049 [Bacillus sp. PvP124]|nr:hypothetical protein [Bacillus sp. PvP124]
MDATQSKDSLETFIGDLVLQALSLIAQCIDRRQLEKIETVLYKGISFGYPKFQVIEDFFKA